MPALCVSAHIYCTPSEHVSQDDGNICPLCACQPTYIAHPQSMSVKTMVIHAHSVHVSPHTYIAHSQSMSVETMVIHAHSVHVSPHILHTLRACQLRQW